ncbi:hypothetical protein PAESOLCIP111_04816 [Paenibacillus solanacearum]|uniref:DUF3886 domain-containing protein n=1 Tax=Paenibacillus solanacearum TaxID=2048548 RepID=A0A916K7Y6_9BACL|nr:YqkE family protein [Paenibacillus solanacearum]CAG7644810.1 hypothetical protein PAESOLCIP111_04816 [Paenibacillus solanacearum]
MVKKKKPAVPQATASQDKQPTLKDLLNPEIVSKLKAQGDAWKAEEEAKREEAKKRAQDAQKAEKKRLENDFEYLLNNSSADWRKHK